MALITTQERYVEAVKELYPEGSFWEEQFADKNSDLSKLAEAQGKNIYDFKIEMNKLWLEARLDTCTEETIADYERLYGIQSDNNLTLEQRKANLKLSKKQDLQIDWNSIKVFINQEYKANILSVDDKIMPALLPETRCGQTRIYGYSAFSLIIITLTIDDEKLITKIEDYICKFLPANKILFFKIINET